MNTDDLVSVKTEINEKDVNKAVYYFLCLWEFQSWAVDHISEKTMKEVLLNGIVM